MAPTDLDRIMTFERRFAQAQATEVIELEWGYAHLQTDFPLSYSHNRLAVTSTITSSEVMATADKILGGAGLAHRYVSIDDDVLGEAVRPDLVAAGYEHDTIVTMIHDGSPPEPPKHEVTEVSVAQLRPALIRDWKLELPDVSDETLDQLADRVSLYSRGADVTLLAVFDCGEIAARGELYVDRPGSIAQFESLVTHPDFRGRGYGGALVRDAVRRSRAAGCELSYLIADANDWPRDWYSRLGYVEARRTHEFTRVGVSDT